MSEPDSPGWKAKAGAKASAAGKSAWKWGYKVSDKIAVHANGLAAKTGSERFWPAANDTPEEIAKAARILTTFTFKGVEETITKDSIDPKTGHKIKKQQKVLKKIPAAALRQAKGLAIYTSFRTGFAPISGAGGAGVVIARLPDGSWSSPAPFMPQNLAAGLVIGIDIYDCVLIIRTEKALKAFYGHKLSFGAELSVTAGPVGAGAMLETGKELSPVWSYVKSKGLYAGLEINGTILISRTDEMARFYQWPGITAEDVLTGKTRVPHEAKVLHQAIAAAEELSDEYASTADESEGIPIPDELDLEDHETLHLPPTPSQLAAFETMSFKEVWEAQDRADAEVDDERIYKRELPPKPPVRADRKPLSSKAQSSSSISAALDQIPSHDSSLSLDSANTSSLYSESDEGLQIPPVADSKIDDREEVFREPELEIPPVTKPPPPPRRRPVADTTNDLL